MYDVLNTAVTFTSVSTQVVLVFLTGLTLSMTAQCTYGDKRFVFITISLVPRLPSPSVIIIFPPYTREHEGIAKEIKTFLGLDSASSAQEQEEFEEGQEHSKGMQKKPAKQKKED